MKIRLALSQFMTLSMTHRERFAAALAHREPDRPPMDLASTDMTEITGGPRALAPLLGLPAGGSPEIGWTSGCWRRWTRTSAESWRSR